MFFYGPWGLYNYERFIIKTTQQFYFMCKKKKKIEKIVKIRK